MQSRNNHLAIPASTLRTDSHFVYNILSHPLFTYLPLLQIASILVKMTSKNNYWNNELGSKG